MPNPGPPPNADPGEESDGVSDPGADGVPDAGAAPVPGADGPRDAGAMALPVPAPAQRAAVIRDAVAVGLATGAYGIPFGALSVAAGLSTLQTAALSVLMFTGASQFAFVSLVGGGGNPLAGAASALLLGVRNGLYGLSLSSRLGVRGLRRGLAAHLVIDESAAMAFAQPSESLGRVGFWATGLAVFGCWNVGTLIGALATAALPDPSVLGLDAVAPAAFLALLAPRLETRRTVVLVATAAAFTLVATPLLPTGVPLLVAALGVVLVEACAPSGATG